MALPLIPMAAGLLGGGGAATAGGAVAAGAAASGGGGVELDDFNPFSGDGIFAPSTSKFQPTTYGVNNQWLGGSPDGLNQMVDTAYAGMAGSQATGAYANKQMMDANRGPQAWENQHYSDQEAHARGYDQAGALQLQREAAMGQAPSEAAWLMQQGLDQGMAGQASMAGSARGAAAIAQAQGNAAANVAGMQGQAYNQAGQLRAAEMAHARGAYGDLASQQRAQDQNRLGMASDMSNRNADRNDQWRLGMGQLGVANDQNAQGWYGAASDLEKSQLGANLATEGMRADQHSGQQALAAGQGQAAADARQQSKDRWINAGISGANTAAGALLD
jgi:hypothetical protein